MLYCFPVTLLVYDDECCICLQHLQRLSPQEWLLPIVVLGFDIFARTNRFLRLFGCLKATMEGSGKILDSLEFFSTNVQCPRMVLKLFLRQGWYVRTQGVLLHFCFSLYWSKQLLEMLWALLRLFLIILCLLPLLFKLFLSWHNRFFKDLSVEQILLILRAWLYGMLLVTWGGWQLLGKRYWLVSVGLEYKSVDSTPYDKELEVSRKEMVVLDISWVNLREGCRLLAREWKFCNSSSLWVHFISTSSINLYQESGLSIDDSSSCFL